MAALPQPGELFAQRFFIDAQLASGGMGAVFAATRVEPSQAQNAGEQVAIKLLHPEFASDEAMRRRFRREGVVLQSLRDPGVVRVLEVGTDTLGRCYTVMELLDGETLGQRLHRGPMAPAELNGLVSGLAQALDAAHGHGVLHGDLKPANVFLGPRGVKLVDFGSSKVFGLERLTRTGDAAGTPLYMAPELLTGEGELDLRIDVYAFGVLLYECLTGCSPFTEANPGRLLYQIVMGEGVPLSERVPALSPELVAVVKRAMAPRKDARWESAGALAEAWVVATSRTEEPMSQPPPCGD